MKRYLQIFLLAVGFDLYWFLVVWLGIAILALMMLPPARRLYALLLAVAGSCLDALWALTGLIDFHGEGVLPFWMIALWLMFATVWTQLASSTTLPGWILALMAVCGGPVAYWLGQRLGAITFLQPTIVVGALTTGWLVLMLLFHILLGRRQ